MSAKEMVDDKTLANKRGIVNAKEAQEIINYAQSLRGFRGSMKDLLLLLSKRDLVIISGSAIGSHHVCNSYGKPISLLAIVKEDEDFVLR